MNSRLLITILVLVCLTVGAALWLGPVVRENRVTRESVARLQASLDRQTEEIERLNRELRALRTDYRAIERVAREKFGMCRPGEEIYHFEEPAGGSPGTETQPANGGAGTQKGP